MRRMTVPVDVSSYRGGHEKLCYKKYIDEKASSFLLVMLIPTSSRLDSMHRLDNTLVLLR